MKDECPYLNSKIICYKQGKECCTNRSYVNEKCYAFRNYEDNSSKILVDQKALEILLESA